ncbi:hypothetical protein KO481_21460 [Nocardia sp. NEAU-G5]|uniref:Uncharacterized protein n=1 Tax=Nocardia albiluteola TaxID=2842303 RepID=A0ABS6B1A4_9NOCA|nr:hypothetical protein [Nocardia albiluteola]MBU3064087.1 hypothetical protein [Nocardia albiluteola]
MATAQVAPLELLVDGVVSFIAALSEQDFQALVSQARPPDPDPADTAAVHRIGEAA